MNVLPIITRELREQARQPFTFTLRVTGVAALLVMTVWIALRGGFRAGAGGPAFSILHAALCLAIWILVPLSSADCISRERREGTLGLLFLSLLKPRDIVFAKGLAHGLRALTLWLASLPVLIIPSLLGGVTWRDAVFSCAVNLGCLALALGASVLASSCSRAWHRSLALAMVVSAQLIIVFGAILFLGLFAAVALFNRGFTWQQFWDNSPGISSLIELGVMLMIAGAENPSQWLVRMPLAAQNAAVIALGCFTLLAGVTAFGLLLLAARNVRRRWRDEPPSARAVRIERAFCTPIVGQSFLRRWMRRKLEHNPIGWLEQRSWSGRLVMWTWLAVLVSFYSALFSAPGLYLRNFQSVQEGLAAMLMLSVAVTASGSFRRERESGVLELLLIAPLSSWQIINGRLWGMWAQFAPAAALLCGVWVLTATFARNVDPWEGAAFAISFLTLPVIGLYYSLAKTHVISAVLWTLGMGFIFPLLLVNLDLIQNLTLWRLGLTGGSRLGQTALASAAIFGLTQMILAAAFAQLLHRNLERRYFALERSPV